MANLVLHTRRLWLAQAALWAAGLSSAWGQDSNTKPIKIIVPFPPGGSNDIVGRAVAQQLTARTKRNILIENRPGAGGVLGAEAVARAEPDGHTWLLISSTFTMSPAIMKLPFDPVRSFVPIAMLGLGPSVIAVPQALPFQTIKELVEYSKKNPGKINFGTAGVASFQHFALELLMQRSGAAFTTVHYKGGSPALVDLAAGHIQVSLGSLIQMQSFLKAGKIKLLAVAGPKRVDLIPQVPTLKEAGIDMEASNWWGLLAPAGTPAALVEYWHREVNAVLASSEIKTRLASEGAEALPVGRAEFEKLLSEDTAKWAQLAKLTGIKAE
jgi:tripartite-type tricarboxylate transporter receptor subunit TctC